MPLPLGFENWTSDRLVEEITVLLPENHTFMYQPTPSGWVAELMDGETLVWRESDFGKRELLLECLRTLSNPSVEGSLWSPRPMNGMGPVPPTRFAAVSDPQHTMVPDPEDLNPEEIERFFGRSPGD